MSKDIQSLFGEQHLLDEKSVKFLTSALEKNNLPGFDYIEFKQSLHNMKGMGIDEDTAVKTAFATAMTVGLTKDKLIKTANHYREVLNGEEKQFAVALQKQMNSRVQAKAKEVEKLKKQVETHKAKIAELEKKIAQASAVIEKADDDIARTTEMLETTGKNFKDTLQALVNEIDKDIQLIQKNI